MTIVLTGLYRFIEKLGIVKSKKLSLENERELKEENEPYFFKKVSWFLFFIINCSDFSVKDSKYSIHSMLDSEDPSFIV